MAGAGPTTGAAASGRRSATSARPYAAIESLDAEAANVAIEPSQSST